MKSSRAISDKIKNLDELADIIQTLKKERKRIVQCHGVFDLLHPGHIRHFEAARREGEVLIVTVTPDEYVGKGPGRPVFNQRLRVESIAALQCVDYVAINKWPTAVETIKKLKPDVYAKGSDYADPSADLSGGISKEEAAIKSIGGRIHFTDEPTFSSTKLLNLHFNVYPEKAERFLEHFRQRYTADDIIERLHALGKMKILVIGDAIIDEYHYCEALGKSPKGTTITTRYIGEEVFAGGVLAAANHIAGFCENVHLVTCLGKQNSYEEFVTTHLKPNITLKFFERDDTSTTVKRRFVQPNSLSKMFEVCFMDEHDLPESVNREVCEYLKNTVKDYDLVLVADFGHGFIGKDVVKVLCDSARFLAVNTQTNSANTGYNLIIKYPRADYICIDEPEARLACRDRFSRLEDITQSIAEKLQCNRVIITHGSFDTLAYTPEEGFFNIPVFSNEVVDTTGAGDALLSVTSPCVAAGYPIELAGFIGNAVGALKVRIVCNRSSVEPTSLFKFITALLK